MEVDEGRRKFRLNREGLGDCTARARRAVADKFRERRLPVGLAHRAAVAREIVADRTRQKSAPARWPRIFRAADRDAGDIAFALRQHAVHDLGPHAGLAQLLRRALESPLTGRGAHVVVPHEIDRPLWPRAVRTGRSLERYNGFVHGIPASARAGEHRGEHVVDALSRLGPLAVRLPSGAPSEAHRRREIEFHELRALREIHKILTAADAREIRIRGGGAHIPPTVVHRATERVDGRIGIAEPRLDARDVVV